MNARVALVIVSHSDLLARGVVEVAQQMAPHVWCEPAGGTDEGRLGTSMARIERAVAVANTARRSAEGGGVLIMSDLGSATMNVDAFVELHDHPDDLIHVAHAPLVEGSVAAAVAAQQGRSLHEVARAAQDAAHCPQQQESHPQSLAHDEREAGEDPPASSTDRARLSEVEGASEETTHPGTAVKETAENSTTLGESNAVEGASYLHARAQVADPAGLHARPAALLVRALAPYEAHVTLNGADASSVLEVMSLGISHGDTVSITASGSQAADALAAAVTLLEGHSPARS